MAKPLTEHVVPDFGGQLLTLYVKNPTPSQRRGELVEYPTLDRRNGKVVLVGRSPYLKGSEWVSGRQVAVAWESIRYYVVFASRQEYIDRILRSKGKRVTESRSV